ncbi:MAG: hypothetical protein L0241_03530 [Planctomycetia bacterium]|nr:hypothetical protein [Planctomycetia bacterium]
MTEVEALEQAAERYRADGYEVTANPTPEQLPESLRRSRPALLGKRNGKSVLVEVWTRGRVNDLPPALLPPGWSFDVVLLPPPEYPDAPGPGNEATPEFTRLLLDELDNLLPRKASQARFLVAWAAAEAGMRVAAGRSGLAADRLPTKAVARELVSAGVLSHDQYERFDQLLEVRNRLVHGVPGDGPRTEQVEFLAGIARALLGQTPVAAAG